MSSLFRCSKLLTLGCGPWGHLDCGVYTAGDGVRRRSQCHEQHAGRLASA